MHTAQRKRFHHRSSLARTLEFTALFVCLLTGCADGPFGDLAALNPWIRQKWQEDERFGPTFHRRLADLRALKSSAPGLEPDQKEKIAADMGTIIQNDGNPVLRAEAVGVLGELAIPAILPALHVAVNDSDKDVRVAACHAWGRAGAGDALFTLRDVIQRDSDVDVRLAAVSELGKFKDAAAVDALGAALDDLDPAIQHAAVQSLKSSTGLNYGDSVPAWRDYVQGRQPSTPLTPSLVERLTNWW
jgi:HEAT repeat protein